MAAASHPAAAVIQWGLEHAETASHEAFRRAVLRRIDQACRTPGTVLAVFPELTGIWLQFSRLCSPVSSRRYSRWTYSLRHMPKLLSAFLHRDGAARLAAQVDLDSWLSPFREAARQQGIYICPGSSFVMDASSRRVYNTSCLISPDGEVMGLRRKIHLTGIEQRLNTAAGNCEEDLEPFSTSFGEVGIAICLDGFYRDAVSRLDRGGCEIVLQPSANSVPWDSSLKRRGYRVVQRDEWLFTGIGSLIQDCRSIRVALNTMDVTDHPLLRNSGCSSAWKRGITSPIAIAPDPNREHQLIIDIGR